MKKLLGSNQGEGSGRKLNKTTENLKPVPNIKNDYFIYTFLIDVPVIWQRITNGEKVLIQPDTARNLNYHHFNFESSNPCQNYSIQLKLHMTGFCVALAKQSHKYVYSLYIYLPKSNPLDI